MARNLEQMGVEAIIKNLPKYLGGMDKMGKSTQKTQGIIGKIGGIAKGALQARARSPLSLAATASRLCSPIGTSMYPDDV